MVSKREGYNASFVDGIGSAHARPTDRLEAVIDEQLHPTRTEIDVDQYIHTTGSSRSSAKYAA